MSLRRTLARGVLAAFLALPQLASAQAFIQREIRDDPRGSVIARLLSAFNAHAEPMSRWYIDALGGRHVNTGEYASFSRQMETATFVSATYAYTVGGETRHRIYHARSGRNEPDTGLPGVQALRSYRDYVDATQPGVVAWDQMPPPSSHVTHSPLDDGRHADARRRDAELKIARRIEADIRAGVVAMGGWLNVYASQVPCGSCEQALLELSRQADISVHIAYLGRGSAAYRRFQRQREAFMTTIQVAANGGQRNTLHIESTVALCDRACLGSDDAANDQSNEIDDSPARSGAESAPGP
ncbi:hypothetical protein [Luteibacter aegosomatissinici]|uniref:hypothetical protein n=1 Tax=Luteibacter aegosomatissinici TaxID=2911539 RepID=UPI001FFC14C6|nr:hypothetical protein [Luteibacter aegosomatissinici]UPG94937.1 hypothetical protein L2Y97_02180 [Luteibacter aegosomatissinici]